MSVHQKRSAMLAAAMFLGVSSIQIPQEEPVSTPPQVSHYVSKGKTIKIYGTNVASKVHILHHDIGGFSRQRLRNKLVEWELSGELPHINVEATVLKALSAWPGETITVVEK